MVFSANAILVYFKLQEEKKGDLAYKDKIDAYAYFPLRV
jgi:hypothetical protein